MVESYKIPSKLTNILVFLAGFIVYIGKDELAKIMPVEYAYLAPIIVMVAGYIAVQKTENIRVERAEQKAVEEYEAPQEE